MIATAEPDARETDLFVERVASRPDAILDHGHLACCILHRMHSTTMSRRNVVNEIQRENPSIHQATLCELASKERRIKRKTVERRKPCSGRRYGSVTCHACLGARRASFASHHINMEQRFSPTGALRVLYCVCLCVCSAFRGLFAFGSSVSRIGTVATSSRISLVQQVNAGCTTHVTPHPVSPVRLAFAWRLSSCSNIPLASSKSELGVERSFWDDQEKAGRGPICSYSQIMYLYCSRDCTLSSSRAFSSRDISTKQGETQ